MTTAGNLFDLARFDIQPIGRLEDLTALAGWIKRSTEPNLPRPQILVVARDRVAARGIALFRSWQDDRAGAVHRTLTRQGLLIRRCDRDTSEAIRIGLPGGKAHSRKLERVLVAREFTKDACAVEP